MRQLLQPGQQPMRHPSVIGSVRHEIGATVRHVILVTLLTVVISALCVEAVGMALTWMLPTLPTHLAAGVIALALGYAAAVTILFQAVLRGIGQSAEWVTGEIEGATERILHDGSRQHAPASATPGAHVIPPTSPIPTRPLSTLGYGVMAGIHAD